MPLWTPRSRLGARPPRWQAFLGSRRTIANLICAWSLPNVPPRRSGGKHLVPRLFPRTSCKTSSSFPTGYHTQVATSRCRRRLGCLVGFRGQNRIPSKLPGMRPAKSIRIPHLQAMQETNLWRFNVHRRQALYGLCRSKLRRPHRRAHDGCRR